MSKTPRKSVVLREAPQATQAVYIRTCDVFWDTPFQAELWKAIIDLTKGTKNLERHSQPKGHEHIWVRLGPALPHGSDSHVADAFCVREEKSDLEPLHWGLNIRAKPKSRPPASVIAEDKRIGGKVGLARFINSTFGTDAIPVGIYNVQYSVEEKAGWKCKLVPKNVKLANPALAEIGRTAILEEIGYRFTDGVLGISELAVIYLHRPRRWNVTVRARAPVRVGDDLQMPLCKELSDFMLARLFEKVDIST